MQCVRGDITDLHSSRLSALSPSTAASGRTASLCGGKKVIGIYKASGLLAFSHIVSRKGGNKG